MPEPIPVNLEPHSPAWAEAAEGEIERIAPSFGANLVTIHHVGSTAIPGISAKPIIDLMPVVKSLEDLDKCREGIEALGYGWWGEFGIAGRRYCTLSDPMTSARRVQIHCFEEGSSEIERLLAFRDYLRAHPDVAREYDVVKAQCRELHPLDSHAYTDCKDPWIVSVRDDSIAFFRSRVT